MCSLGRADANLCLRAADPDVYPNRKKIGTLCIVPVLRSSFTATCSCASTICRMGHESA